MAGQAYRGCSIRAPILWLQTSWPDFRAERWPLVYRAGLAFLDTFGEQAAALGWTTLELFGVHPVVGVVRVDCAGALMVVGRSHVVALTADTIRFDNGLTYRRTPGAPPSVPVWDFRARQSP